MVAIEIAKLLWMAGAPKSETVDYLASCSWGDQIISREEIELGIDQLYHHWDRGISLRPQYNFVPTNQE